LVGTHRRLKNFDSNDLNLLLTLVSEYHSFLTLPYILAETSNLLGIGKRAPAEAVAAYLTFAKSAEELPVESGILIDQPVFARFGLTDTAILALSRSDTHVLTVDHGLHSELLKLEIQSTNLRHHSNVFGGR